MEILKCTWRRIDKGVNINIVCNNKEVEIKYNICLILGNGWNKLRVSYIFEYDCEIFKKNEVDIRND